MTSEKLAMANPARLVLAIGKPSSLRFRDVAVPGSSISHGLPTRDTRRFLVCLPVVMSIVGGGSLSITNSTIVSHP